MALKLQSIQYLRALAAIAVVLHHARNPQPWLFNPLAGYTGFAGGVDVFFVISGFIMYTAARDETPAKFLYRRAARIFPLYWLATFAAFAVGPAVGVGFVIRSLVLIPQHSPLAVGIYPLLVPGWTLVFEIFFYLVFAAGLAVRRPFALTLGVLCLLVLAGRAHASQSAAWLTYTSPLLLEFALGMVGAKFLPAFPPRFTPLLAPLGIVGLAATGFLHPPPELRALYLGVPAACLVLGAVALEQRGELPRMPVVGLLGDASYAIYLFQLAALHIAVNTVQRLPVLGGLQLPALMIVAAGVSSVMGVLVHKLAEKPALHLLSRQSPRTAPTPTLAG